jgi:transcriptional regulator with XRE-family HTH domain
MELVCAQCKILGMAENNFLAVPTFLAKWRKHRGMTQEALGAAVGMTASSISQLENGKQGFSDKSLADLARALKCTPVALLACDPAAAEFWELFEIAQKLEGADRRRALNIIRSALDLDRA